MKIGDGALLFFGIRARWMCGVQNQGENAVQVAGPLIHRGDVFVEREFAGAQANWSLGRGQKQIRQAT